MLTVLQLVKFLLTCFISFKVYAQGDSLPVKAVQARVHLGFIIAHSQAVQNTAGSYPYGIELEFYKQKKDTSTWDLCHCYPSKGFSFSYFNFDNTVLGHGMTVAYYLEPSYRLGKKMQFKFRGSGGVSYLTNPYDIAKNPTNMSYSTYISGYLQLGIATSYQLSKNWLTQLGVQYQHISNGGLKEPNKGINWPTAAIGFTYFPQKYNLPSYKRRVAKFSRGSKPYWEAGIFFSAKQGYANEKGSRTPLVGLLVQGAKQVGRTNSLTATVEGYYDNALRQRLNKDSLEASATRIGALVGHDFLLGKIFFSQQIGVYLLQQSPYFDRVYHRWAIRYQFKPKWMIGIALKAHRHVADFIDLRLVYRLQ